jgi:branched-chain amino acid transport system permease protein
LFQVVLSGLSIGAVYGLIGMALSVSFYVTRVINFSQGQALTAAIMVAAILAEAGFNPWLGALIGILSACLLGVLSYYIAVRPILKADRFSFGWMVSTLAFGLIAENGIAYLVGPRSRGFPALLNDDVVHIGNAVLTGQQLLAILVALLAAAGFELFRTRTLFGKVAMATAADPEMAGAIGVNITVVAVVTFAISGFLAGIAGVLVAPRTFANPYLGGTFNTFGFVAMMIGGGTEIPVAAMYGGLLLGVMSEAANSYINSQASDWFPFLVLVVILIVTPKGLFSSSNPLFRARRPRSL